MFGYLYSRFLYIVLDFQCQYPSVQLFIEYQKQCHGKKGARRQKIKNHKIRDGKPQKTTLYKQIRSRICTTTLGKIVVPVAHLMGNWDQKKVCRLGQNSCAHVGRVGQALAGVSLGGVSGLGGGLVGAGVVFMGVLGWVKFCFSGLWLVLGCSCYLSVCVCV